MTGNGVINQLKSGEMPKIAANSSHTILLIDSCAFTRACIKQMLAIKTQEFVVDDHEIPPKKLPVEADLILFNAQYLTDDFEMVAQLELIRNYGETLPLVVMSTVDDSAIVREAFARFNLKGYIPLSYGMAVMVAALRLVMAGGTFVPNSVLDICSTVSESRTEKTILSDVLNLTSREREVLSLICEGKPNKIIAFTLNISEQTVKVHVKNMMKKLNLTNRTQLAVLQSIPTGATL